jgi:hypothetical protein
MAAFRGRQAQYGGFAIDSVGYSEAAANDSFLTRAANPTQESNAHMLGVGPIPYTTHRRIASNRHFGYVERMLRNRNRMVSATKGTFGAGNVVRDRQI